MKNFTAIFNHYQDGIGFFHSIKLDGQQLVKDGLVIEYPPANLKQAEIVVFKANIRFEAIEFPKYEVVA